MLELRTDSDGFVKEPFIAFGQMILEHSMYKVYFEASRNRTVQNSTQIHVQCS